MKNQDIPVILKRVTGFLLGIYRLKNTGLRPCVIFIQPLQGCGDHPNGRTPGCTRGYEKFNPVGVGSDIIGIGLFKFHELLNIKIPVTCNRFLQLK